MPSAQRSVVIELSRRDVFDFFTDPTNDSRWRPQVKEVSVEGPIRVGTRIHQVVQGPGGRGIPADIEVTAHEPPDRYAFQVVAGPVRPTGEFRFTGEGETTTVTFSLEAQLSGLKQLFLARPVQKSMDGEMQALDRAKSLLETG